MENIGQSNAGDAFYRYKRPKLVARIEGRGNGIKTNTVNLVDIAKALERPPDYVLKYFGCELGAQTKYDKVTNTCIVNGAHEVGKLNELLEAFTKKYVQCHQCGNPETRVRIKKENIHLKCKACGFVSDVDMRHAARLNTYIIKNPPEDKISKAEKRLKKMEEERMKEAAGDNLDKEAKIKRKKDKAEKKKKKEKGGEDENEDPSATEGGEDDDDDEEEYEEVVWMTDTSEAAVAARAAEQLSQATSEMVTQGNLEAERAEARKAEKARKKEEARLAAETEAKTEAEAKAAAEAEAKAKAEAEEAAKRKAEEDAQLAKEGSDKLSLAEGNSSNGTEDAAVAAVRDLVASPSYTPKKVTTKLKQLDYEGGVAGRAKVLFLALFGNLGSHKLGPAIEARSEVLQAEAGDDPTKQVGQLVALEYLVGVALPDKLKQTAVALKALYDEDVIEEDVILAWHDKAAAAQVLGVTADVAAAVRDAAAPFVEWLKEASDEDEDSDDEE